MALFGRIFDFERLRHIPQVEGEQSTRVEAEFGGRAPEITGTRLQDYRARGLGEAAATKLFVRPHEARDIQERAQGHPTHEMLIVPPAALQDAAQPHETA